MADTQSRAGLPVTPEQARLFGASVKRRVVARADIVALKIERFCKRDAATCSTPVGTMRARSLLGETGTKMRTAVTPKVRDR